MLEVVLGNRTNLADAAAKGVRVNRIEADAFAMNVLPIVHAIQAAGIGTLQGVADALDARGVRTARDGRWYPTTVRNLLRHDLPSVQHIAAERHAGAVFL